MNIKKNVITIPNILSLFRIALIPVIAWEYCTRQDYGWAGGLLILSGVTDIVDGYIARHFNMVSDLGKVLDPIADKLTQAVMLICLLLRFPLMAVPLCLLVLKETFMSVTGFLVIRRTGKVYSAAWHGKAATVLIYTTMILHTFFYAIPDSLSAFLIGATSVMICISFSFYSAKNVRTLKENQAPSPARTVPAPNKQICQTLPDLAGSGSFPCCL